MIFSDWILLILSITGFIFLYRYTDGPWDIFFEFRLRLGIFELMGEDGELYDSVEDKFFAKLFDCHWCIATWIILPLSIVYYRWEFFLYWLSSVLMIGTIIEVLKLIRKYNHG